MLRLEKMGHEVMSRHLASENAWETERLISPEQVYRCDMTWIEQLD